MGKRWKFAQETGNSRGPEDGAWRIGGQGVGKRGRGRAGNGRNQGQLPRHTTWAVTRDPGLRRVLHLVQCSAVIVLKSFLILNKGFRICILHRSHQLCSWPWKPVSRFSRKQSPRQKQMCYHVTEECTPEKQDRVRKGMTQEKRRTHRGVLQSQLKAGGNNDWCLDFPGCPQRGHLSTASHTYMCTGGWKRKEFILICLFFTLPQSESTKMSCKLLPLTSQVSGFSQQQPGKRKPGWTTLARAWPQHRSHRQQSTRPPTCSSS